MHHHCVTPAAGTLLARVLDLEPRQEATVADAKPMISFDDFVKVDLRVATITKAEHHPNADRLLKLQLDDGSGEPRQICAGIRGHYEPSDLEGRQIVIVANLAPRTIRGEESRGMLLAASSTAPDGEDRSVVVVTPMASIDNGSAVS
jgi:methionine--tRNA ligase beta chain